MQIFVENLIHMMGKNSLATYTDLADFLNINTNTLKSWVSGHRSIPLPALDSIADYLQIPTYLLIKRQSRQESRQDAGFSNKIEFKNNSKAVLSNNLQQIFINKSKITWSEQIGRAHV